MSDRRLLFYNDARHFYIYCYDPPMRLEDAWAPVDEIAGTRVDTLVYGFGAGPTMFHDTQAGEVWGRRLETFKGLHAWRAYENVKSLIDRGLDPLNLLIERAHQKGLDFFASLRQTHSVSPDAVDDEFNWQFKVDHPEWCLRGRGKYAFNFVHPEVRAERFAIIEETVNKYDVEGFEVDWAFLPIFFEDGEVEQNTPILTEYMGEIRSAVDKAAEARGRPIELGARVLPGLAGNLAAGLDVPEWLKQGLLDFVVPNIYVDHQMDADFPFEWLVDLARSTGCKVYPALQSRVQSEGEHPGSAAHYRAAAAAYWDKGADAIYLPWFRWPHQPEDREVLADIVDPDLLEEKPKHYVVRRHYEDADSNLYDSPLPLTLTEGIDAPGQVVPLYLAHDPEKGDAYLKLRLLQTTSHDSLTVSLNGVPLPAESCRRVSHSYTYTWLEYPLAQAAFRRGRNEVGVALHSRPINLVNDVVLESVELVVEYVKPQLATTIPIP